jgi:hypothetical protein
MKELKVNLIVLLVGLVIGFMGFKSCQEPNKINTTDTITTIKVDTLTITNTIREKGKLVYQKDTLKLPPAPFDTLKVIDSYFTMRVQEYQYQDTNLTLNILDTIYKNIIVGRGLNYKYNCLQKTITTKIVDTIYIKNKMKFGIGLAASVGLNKQINTLSPMVGLGMNRCNVSLGYDLRSKSVLTNFVWYLKK